MRCNTDNFTFSYRFISFISHQIPNNYPFPYRFHLFRTKFQKKTQIHDSNPFFFLRFISHQYLGKKKKVILYLSLDLFHTIQ
jgi:hypothetical protein